MSDSLSPLEVPAVPGFVTEVPAADGAAEAIPAGDQVVVPPASDGKPGFYLSSHDVAETPKLSAKQITALKCLSNGDSIQDAALTASVSRTTVWRWLTEHAGSRHEK